MVAMRRCDDDEGEMVVRWRCGNLKWWWNGEEMRRKGNTLVDFKPIEHQCRDIPSPMSQLWRQFAQVLGERLNVVTLRSSVTTLTTVYLSCQCWSQIRVSVGAASMSRL
ncbi:hypothetical protein J1N35_007631 [Gossypium stocksii]|uniref:Uncharacterized protein n=1 Tax=Gossypium stocksii TaxID=47602 RepID=A0A9D4AFS2_9ROSI|nr:hypothetical protein J1N35_007631 [Gossypium stocksii]